MHVVALHTVSLIFWHERILILKNVRVVRNFLNHTSTRNSKVFFWQNHTKQVDCALLQLQKARRKKSIRSLEFYVVIILVLLSTILDAFFAVEGIESREEKERRKIWPCKFGRGTSFQKEGNIILLCIVLVSQCSQRVHKIFSEK